MILVHDYLIQMGGAERVVATMAKAFPDAPIYTSATDFTGLFAEFDASRIHNSWMQRIPTIRKHFKKLFFLYPSAFASFPLPAHTAIWISSSTFAKCIRPAKGSVTFCYCHNPTRFLWDTERYVSGEVANPVLNAVTRVFFPWLRKVDLEAAQRMDYLIANSENVRERIRRIYGREADVIHPPVNVERFTPTAEHGGYDVVVSRLIAYKNIELAVRAYEQMGRELRVIGDGTDRARLQSLAGKHVRFLGRVSEEELHRQLHGCRALVFPGEEDFGISPVEAQACGKPVIAYGKGGALETVIDGETGVFFQEPTVEALRTAVAKADAITWDSDNIRRNAERFSEAAFLEKMIGYMEERCRSLVIGH